VRAFGSNVVANVIAGGILVIGGWLIHRFAHGHSWAWALVLALGVLALAWAGVTQFRNQRAVSKIALEKPLKPQGVSEVCPAQVYKLTLSLG
jgi:MFS family permease